ncbi:MAG: glutathione S-transferase family protein [Pseudomonadota bacterium]
MRLYCFPVAPNPTRVMVYVREKGIDLEQVSVNLTQGETQTPKHLARNPRGTIPVLELDDGSYLTESLVIMEYLEELYPEPSMIGRDPLRRARTRSFERQVETSVLFPITRCVHATNSPLGLPANPELASYERGRLAGGLQALESQLHEGPFAMGERVSIVDCTLFAALQFAEFFALELPDDYPKLVNWYEQFKTRS